MIEINKLLLLVLGELVLVSLVVSAIVTFTAISKRQADREALKKLIARINEDSPRREAETRKILEHQYGLSGDTLESAVRGIVRSEKAFYQVLIDVYLRRNTEALQNLCVDYEGSVDAYRTLEISKPGVPSVGADTETDTEDSEELMLLKEENRRLADELQLTMDAMGRMIKEYSLMFSGGVDVELERSKMRELLSPEVDSVEEALPAEEGEAVDEGAVTRAPESGLDGPEVPLDDELQMLDDDLDMLNLSGEALSDSADLDETVVFNLKPGDEAENLEALLDDPDQKKFKP